MSCLRRISSLVAFFFLTTFAAGQSQPSCAVDTSSNFNVKICSPKNTERVPGRFTLSFSAHSGSSPLTAIKINAWPGANEEHNFTANSSTFARDVTMNLMPIYESYGILVQAWNANGEKAEAWVAPYVRKTAGTCPYINDFQMNLCEPAASAVVTSPVKVVANALSLMRPVSHVKVYINETERYFANDDEVYTYIGVPPGNHTITVQAWDSFGWQVLDQRSITVVDRQSYCATMTNPGVQLCQPQENETTNAPLRLTARTNAGSVPITYMRLYRDSQPVWEGDFSSINTDLHLGQLGLEAGTYTFGMVAWSQQGAAFVDTAQATVKGYMSPPMCAIPPNQTVVICAPGPGDVVSASTIVSARATWPGKRITAMRIYVDYQEILTEFPNADAPYIYKAIHLEPGQHRIVVVAWTNFGDVMVTPERKVTVY